MIYLFLVLGNIKSRYWEHIPNIFSILFFENMLGICSQYRLLMLPKTSLEFFARSQLIFFLACCLRNSLNIFFISIVPNNVPHQNEKIIGWNKNECQ